jgi:hypothetical protein
VKRGFSREGTKKMKETIGRKVVRSQIDRLLKKIDRMIRDDFMRKKKVQSMMEILIGKKWKLKIRRKVWFLKMQRKGKVGQNSFKSFKLCEN